MPKFELIVLQAYFAPTGTAVLPVGAIVRDPASGEWRDDFLSVHQAQGWRGRLALQDEGAPLSEDVVARWEAEANGVTWDLRHDEVEGKTLADAVLSASNAVLAGWAILSEEI